MCDWTLTVTVINTMQVGDAGVTAIATDDATRLAVVQARIIGYHDVTFAQVLDVISYLRDPGDSVIAGGSLTLGLGNQLSDLDIVVSGPSSAESSPVPLEHWVKTLRVDVWKRRSDAMDELIGRAERVLNSDAAVDGLFGDIFEESDLKLLHRVAFGITIDGPVLEPKATRPYRQIAAEMLVREYAERMREAALVAQLAATAGDTAGALSNARLAVHSALHASVCAHGLPFTGDKWLRERLQIDAPRLLDVHESFAVLPDDPKHANEFVAAAVGQCERLSDRDLSLHSLLGEVRVHPGELTLLPAGAQRFLISTERDGIWELDPAAAQAWTCLGEQRSFTCDPADTATLELAYQLYATGLAELRWQFGVPLAEVAFADGEIA